MIQWDLFFVTCLVIGIVIWAILYLRHSNATSRPFSIPPAPYFAGDPQSPLWETLMLPQAGTLRGTNIPVNLASNILVFRSQMKTRTGSEFRFPVAQFISNPPAPIPLDVQLQKLYDSQKRGQMLYDQVTSKELSLPWPPEASAQLVTYYPDPTKQPDTLNSLRCGPSQLEASEGAGTNPQPFPLSSVKVVAVPYPGIPGEPEFVLAAGISNFSSAQNQQLQTSTELEAVALEFQDTGVVYVECAGGSGGSYLSGVGKNAVNFQGGRGGLVWAYLSVQKGDIWQIQLAQNGAKLTPVELKSLVNPSNSSASGGGLGSFLAGSEGGGATWISTHQPQTPNGPVPSSRATSVIMSAGGGGGASRNAFGGSAGLALPMNWETQNFFGSAHPNPLPGAFPGGPINTINEEDIFVPNSYHQQVTKNGISGGGGSNTKAGESQTASELSNQGYPKTAVVRTSSGSPLKGGVGSENPPGGGGGGAGLQGGGAGTWNGLNAPNNEHGAGGGGSSSVPRVTGCTNASIVNRNPQFTTKWPNAFNYGRPSNDAPPVAVFDASAYFMIAIPQQKSPFVNLAQQNPNVKRNNALRPRL